MRPDALRAAVAARARPARRGDGPVDEVVRQLAAWAGDSLSAVIFFGSQKTRASPDPHSAYDLFAVCGGYGRFYRALHAAGAVRRGPALLAALNGVLPPNEISLRAAGGGEGAWHAKCAVISLRAFQRETSARRRDHFCMGRLFQPVELAFAADAASAEAVLDGLVSAHRLTYRWVAPWLPASFDAERYCRTLLRVSLSQEIRPEPQGRADALFQAQRDDLLPVYGVLLEELASAGELRPLGGGAYARARPGGPLERARVKAYFAWSLARATARWAKHMVTFEGWLEYIVRKAERHSGQKIVLTPRERRLPLLFLWPRLVRYLRHKDEKGRRA